VLISLTRPERVTAAGASSWTCPGASRFEGLGFVSGVAQVLAERRVRSEGIQRVAVELFVIGVVDEQVLVGVGIAIFSDTKVCPPPLDVEWSYGSGRVVGGPVCSNSVGHRDTTQTDHWHSGGERFYCER
jgi:hypothetical protein